MYATFKFDTEDIFYPPQYRIDDIPGWLAEIMSEEGIRGSFCVFGEKARSLLARGRRDVLESMARHDLLSHTQGNCRPLLTEILADKGWEDGMTAMRAYEDCVVEDFQAGFGRGPCGFSRHNLYWAPQHVALAGERGLPYMTGIVGSPDTDQPTWYAGTLMIPSASTPSFGGFDQLYSCDAAFEAHLTRLDEYLRQCLQRKVEYVSIFACHPVQVMACGWIEEYVMANGLSRPVEEIGWRYAVKTPAEESRAKANFRRLVQFIRDYPGLEVVGAEEAGRLFATQPAEISRDELTAYAAEVERADRPLLHRTFSPAELTCGLAESLVLAAQNGDLPLEVPRRGVLGPTDLPVVGREVDLVSQAELVELCRQLVDQVAATGHPGAPGLPANLRHPRGRVGLGQLAVLVARGYRAQSCYEQYGRLRVSKTTRYPDIALELDAWVQRSIGEHWPYDPAMSCEKLALHARLQSWTLKPAWLRPPRGATVPQARLSAP